MKFTEEHEWLRTEGDIVVVGITEHASTQLGDVVFVELPEEGTTVSKDDEIVVIESVKAASDILAPLDGEIIEINRSRNLAKVKAVNMLKKHKKATKENKGGIITKEGFIHLSNLKKMEATKGKSKK